MRTSQRSFPCLRDDASGQLIWFLRFQPDFHCNTTDEYEFQGKVVGSKPQHLHTAIYSASDTPIHDFHQRPVTRVLSHPLMHNEG